MNRSIRGVTAAAAVVVLGVALTGCGQTDEPVTANDALSVYATTGYLADAVINIAPDAEVTTMVGPGGDPHTYQPSTQDIEKMREADVVLWNGLHLEAQMIDQLESLGDRQVAVAEQIPEALLLPWPDVDDEGEPLFDPHVWNSPEAWSIVIELIADTLGEHDPENAANYAKNAEAYLADLDVAVADARSLLEEVPEANRILVTGHDAFGYFGSTFGFEVHATDFISTDAQLSAEELSDLADLIADRQVPTIFLDNQVSPQAITSLREAVESRGWQVNVAEAELYADSLGAESGVDTYLGVLSHNAQAVADGLGAA